MVGLGEALGPQGGVAEAASLVNSVVGALRVPFEKNGTRSAPTTLVPTRRPSGRYNDGVARHRRWPMLRRIPPLAVLAGLLTFLIVPTPAPAAPPPSEE